MNTEEYEQAVDAQFALSEQDRLTDLRDPNTRTQCRVEGCTNDAPRRGPYAGRCTLHQHLALSDLAAANGADAAKTEPVGGEWARAVLAVDVARVALHEALVELGALIEQELTT